MRKKYGKKNGKLPLYFFDHPSFEIQGAKNKNRYQRHKEKGKRE
jgi:hypothetical protein